MPRPLRVGGSHVTEEMVAAIVPAAPIPSGMSRHHRSYLDAGFDEVYVNQIGPEQEGFFEFYTKELKPRLGL